MILILQAKEKAKAKVVERYVDLVVCVCCADSILRVCCGIISYLFYFFIFHRATTPRIPRVPRVPRKTRAPRAREVERSAPRARVVAARARADEEVDTEGILKLITGQRLTTFQKKRPN